MKCQLGFQNARSYSVKNENRINTIQTSVLNCKMIGWNHLLVSGNIFVELVAQIIISQRDYDIKTNLTLNLKRNATKDPKRKNR